VIVAEPGFVDLKTIVAQRGNCSLGIVGGEQLPIVDSTIKYGVSETTCQSPVVPVGYNPSGNISVLYGDN